MYCTDALAILLDFYEYQVALGLANYLELITDVRFFARITHLRSLNYE